VGAVALSLLSITACGSGTSVKDFCKAGDQFAEANEFDQGVKAAKKLDDTGAPDGMPTQARQGFAVVVELVTEADDQGDLEKRYTALTEKQRKAVSALDAYIAKSC
jgi:hypothetical protein